MDIFAIFGFLGGLALFLYGMRVMGAGLESVSGGRLKGLVARLCSTPLRGVLVGAAATAAVQSSSATTVMVIGFVNSGIMRLEHAVGVIMGANLGTTVTSWVLSLTGIEGDNFFVRLLKPSSLAPLLTLAGVILATVKKKSGLRRVGGVFAGLGILFFGMEMMSGSVAPLAESEKFTGILTLFSNPLAGLAAGILLTAIVQSSSASVGILQALSLSGGITFSSAIPIVMGQNIGTCVTTLLSSIGASKNARRAAFIHLYFNIAGTAVLLLAFYGSYAVFGYRFYSESVDPFYIAVIHTVFNVASTVILLPFSKILLRLAEYTVGGRQKGENVGEYDLLDERFLRFPATALQICRMAHLRMCELTQENLSLAERQFGGSDEERARKISENELLIDAYEDNLGAYLIRLSSADLNDGESAELTRLIYAIGDTERIGDYAEGLASAASLISDDGTKLSAEAEYERERLCGALRELLGLTVGVLEDLSQRSAAEVEPLRDVVDELCADMRARHIERLRSGVCDPSAASAFDGILLAAERIAGHCSNLAVGILRRQNEALNSHEYLRRERTGELFTRKYIAYKAKYGI